MDLQQKLWLKAPEHPILTTGEVHIWRVYLNQDPSTIQRSFKLLSALERQRAGKYHFQRDHDHFAVARGGLRMILSRYINLPPAQICFSVNQYGKPAVCYELGGNSLKFNVAHAGDVALYAFTLRREIGIDIEHLTEDCLGLELAECFFSPAEASMLRGVAPALRTVAFFDCWTRKEAYIKARGEGLSYPLNRFTVSLTPGHPASLLATDDDPSEVSRWTLMDVFPGHKYRAALAVEGPLGVLHCWHGGVAVIDIQTPGTRQ
jgi:4'-phosphopantetheinyl transferase